MTEQTLPGQDAGAMSDEQLAAIEHRWAAATPGPWRWRHEQFNATKPKRKDGRWLQLLTGPVEGRSAGLPDACRDAWDYPHVLSIGWAQLKRATAFNMGVISPADQDAIAHAPTDVAALLAEVRRLRESAGEAAPAQEERRC